MIISEGTSSKDLLKPEMRNWWELSTLCVIPAIKLFAVRKIFISLYYIGNASKSVKAFKDAGKKFWDVNSNEEAGDLSSIFKQTWGNVWITGLKSASSMLAFCRQAHQVWIISFFRFEVQKKNQTSFQKALNFVLKLIILSEVCLTTLFG